MWCQKLNVQPCTAVSGLLAIVSRVFIFSLVYVSVYMYVSMYMYMYVCVFSRYSGRSNGAPATSERR